MKKYIILTILVIILITIFSLVFDLGRREVKAPAIESNASTTENVEQNSPATSSMPIIVNNIKDNQEISSPLEIEGKARGNWFFEGSFPVELVDIDGNSLAKVPAQAIGDWMTTDYVNFTVTLDYKKSTSTNKAFIILSKDNPSGLPEFYKSIAIPVILK